MKEEKEILELLYKGDENAIRMVFDEYYERLCLYASAIIKKQEPAEEIVVDILVYLWINASHIMINTSLNNYLFKSVYNNCLKYLQKENKERLQEAALLESQDHALLRTSMYGDPESDLIMQDLERKVEKIIMDLPEQCREIYKLSRIENLSYSQIAKKLQITSGTVKTQMSRAFLKFRKEFGDLLTVLAVIAISITGH